MTGTLYKSAPVWLASLMMIASHLEVGFVFCWVIVAETLEYQNAFIKILSQPVFTRYAKITYAMYLFTPIVTIIICGLLRTERNYNAPEIVSIKSYEVMILNCKILLSLDHHFVRNLENHRSDFLSRDCIFWSSILQLFSMRLAEEEIIIINAEDEIRLKVRRGVLWGNYESDFIKTLSHVWL